MILRQVIGILKKNYKSLPIINRLKLFAMRRLLLLYIVVFFSIFTSFSQQKKSKMTEEEFHKMRQEIFEIQTSNKDSVMVLVEDMMRIAKSFNDEQLFARALLTKANIEAAYISADAAIKTLNEALEINKRLNNKVELVKIYNNLGNFYFRKSDYLEATKSYLKVVEIAKENNSAATIRGYNGLSDVYVAQGNFKDALKFALLANKYINKETPDDIVANITLGTGIAYAHLNDFKNAENYFKKAAALFKQIGDKYFFAYTLNVNAEIYYKSNPLKSIDLRLEAKTIFDEIAPNRLAPASNLAYLAELYVIAATNDSLFRKIENPLVPKTKPELLKEAQLFYTKALEIDINNNATVGIIEKRKHLSHLQALMSDYKNAYENLLESTTLNDSLFSQENKNTIAKLIFEKEVAELKATNEKKETLNKILVGSSIALMLILFLAYRNFRNKRKVQSLKITELQKDKQLLTVDAMLKGQEEERSRIAKDLHDGLGGLLSGTKLSFIHMKENLILTPENAEQFDKSLSMLDTTIVDLRKVAQNLMPEALVKFGLDEALRDFCNSIQNSSKITVDYQKIGVERKLNNTAEVFVYRIIQELTNNAVKHSKATEIIVQLALSETKTSIAVEDNGIGYDKNKIENKKGSGLDNIEYRVHYFNGEIDTETSFNNGTSVNIVLNV